MPDSSLSRRQWIERVSLPALGVPLAGALPADARQPPSTSTLDGARVYNIRDFGAKGDGTTLDTTAVQAAIDACTRDGGGTVLVPAGTFHIGTIELKSNVTLHLAASATLLGQRRRHAVSRRRRHPAARRLDARRR